MISIALRFVPTFLEEIDRIKEAQMARGANFKTGPVIRRAKSAVSLLVPLVLCSFRRADELATAMEARGYRRGSRTYMRELSMARADYVAVVVMVSITGLYFFKPLFSHPDEIEKKRAFHRAGRPTPVPSAGATGKAQTYTDIL